MFHPPVLVEGPSRSCRRGETWTGLLRWVNRQLLALVANEGFWEPVQRTCRDRGSLRLGKSPRRSAAPNAHETRLGCPPSLARDVPMVIPSTFDASRPLRCSPVLRSSPPLAAELQVKRISVVIDEFLDRFVVVGGRRFSVLVIKTEKSSRSLDSFATLLRVRQ
jgi:hypothetical protein